MSSIRVNIAPELSTVWFADNLKQAPAPGPEEPPTRGAVPFSRILQLRRCGPEPLYYQLAESLQEAVAAGKISHGTRLLPDVDMAHELRLAVGTVRKAWAHLERKGILTRRQKIGTFVL
jgi:hypothetical protein